MNRLRTNVGALLVLLLLGGCVTTVTGGPKVAPDDERLDAQLDLARGYLEQRSWSRARKPLEKALEIDPRSAEAHVLFAFLYQNEDEIELAERHYRSALRIDADNSQALNNYGSFLFAQARYDDAVGPLRQAAENPEYPLRATAYENLGLAEMQLGNADAAEAALLKALQLNFRQPRASLELASMYFDRGRIRTASEYYDNFRSLARQNARSLCLGARIAGAAGDPDSAASYRLALRNLYPDASCQESS